MTRVLHEFPTVVLRGTGPGYGPNLENPVCRWHVRLEFKPADLWIGAYWTLEPETFVKRSGLRMTGYVFNLWLCLVPCLPLHLVVMAETEVMK